MYILFHNVNSHGGDRKTTEQVECKEAGIECLFMLRAESDDELVFTQQHVKKAHKKDVSKADVLKLAKRV